MAKTKEKMGSIKKIYILHGWVYDTKKWLPLVDELKKIGINTELLKIPGLTAEINEPWALNDYVNWLEKTIPKNEKVVLLGHSNGGRIAIAFAEKFPERIFKLFLIDSAGLPDTRIRPLLKKNISKVLSKIGKAFTNSEKSKMFFYNLIKEKDYASASPIMQKTMANLISIDLTKSLAKIKIPTIIIWGEKDKTTPLYMAKILENNIANSELIILPNANHSPHFTHSKVIAKIINEKINF